MIIGKKVLALIPARGGSKRLPRKNILEFAGKPMIAWTIEAALKSLYVDQVFVTTDDKEIAYISREYGASVPFIRPENLSDDSAKTIDVILHSLDFFERKGNYFDYLVLLQPTSPLRNHVHLDAALEYMQRKKGECIVGVTEIEHPVEWVTELPESYSLDHFFGSKTFMQTQGSHRKIPARYRINGAIYICSVKRIIKEKTMFLKTNSYGFVMDGSVSVDIDTILDFKLAELQYKSKDYSLIE